MALAARAALVLAVLPVLAGGRVSGGRQAPPDVDAFAKKVREVIRREYAEPVYFNYIEQGRDVDISMLGKVSVGPMQTFEVRQDPPREAWRRLIAVDGKPLDGAELARRDEEHRRKRERDWAESPRERTARLTREAGELRERDEILDDAARVFNYSVLGRETVDGQPIILVSLTPRPDARVTTSDGQRMKHFAGRMWVTDGDYRIARVQLHAIDSVSVGWGVVARVEPGSGFEFVRKKVDGNWVASELTIEGSGRTLLFRKFGIKVVTTYTGHQLYAAPAS